MAWPQEVHVLVLDECDMDMLWDCDMIWSQVSEYQSAELKAGGVDGRWRGWEAEGVPGLLGHG